MDLIDVLWRHDIDLGVTVEPPLMWELEKEQEVSLHKRLEEVNMNLSICVSSLWRFFKMNFDGVFVISFD